MAQNPLDRDRVAEQAPRYVEALTLIGETASPGRFEPEDPQEWAVLIVGAAVNSESAGDAEAQDRLIEAIGIVLGIEVGEHGHGLTVDQAALWLAGERP